MKRAVIMRVNGLTIITAEINKRRHVLINDEAKDVIREVDRLLGLRRCSGCGRWIKPHEASYIEIRDNKVTRVICNQCINEALNILMTIKC